MKKTSLLLFAFLLAVPAGSFAQSQLRLNELEYFELPGINVMVFQDIYPEGHQGGVSIIQNGVRVASNGDVRLEPTPGQWQPVPAQRSREVDRAGNRISVRLAYPDSSRMTGFNPIVYPDLKMEYTVHVTGEGQGFRITVDLDRPLPPAWVGKVGFNMELYPTDLFGKTWYIDGKPGTFPRQPNGPVIRDVGGETQAVPLGSGRRLTVAPETEGQRLTIESHSGNLQLLDGRNKHNNGWFVVRSLIPGNATKGALEWTVQPHAIPGYRYGPVVHVSQLGYHPAQQKVATIELDPSDAGQGTVRLRRATETGGFEDVLTGKPTDWGRFLRFKYQQFDFSRVKEPGVYVVEYGNYRTEPFRIASDVFERHAWQPTLDVFLPVQMCHMRVEEQYRVWHGVCHLDDARMAPINTVHFDGYEQGPSTLSGFKPGTVVPGLNRGGWHDAGDDDLRIESQADEVHILATAYEAFGIDYDETTIDQKNLLVRIHQPDGRPDILQQVEHGVLSILGPYRAMGRLYDGIIVPTLQQYVLQGDPTNYSDNLFYDPSLKPGERTGTHSSLQDDRLIFTEQNATHEYKGIAALAIAARVLSEHNPTLAKESIQAAEALWRMERDHSRAFAPRIIAVTELFLTTRKPEYRQLLLLNRQQIVEQIAQVGWAIGRALPLLTDAPFAADIRNAVAKNFEQVEAQQKETPFGVPYRPVIWGAGWGIQRFGYEQYFLHRAFPDVVRPEYLLNALNFVLGHHPGANTASFASGVGAKSMTVAYGFNRADYSYIPGGVVSGTALIRPDLPELKEFPFLWQQAEYVLGGGASHYMFLVLAADQILKGSGQ